ncbi:MAG: NAD(P)/FAD-dependent oxidoreductase [Acidimicrobiales bacterium]|nr:NAD(P)/FAD-dependent oxidoreductase [Acidimicrobiales bacterium]
MSKVETYDAVVVGASFAGLAAASQLDGAGRVLLADREPVGVGETSACGTLLAVLEQLDAGDALEQVHPKVVINLAGRRVVFETAYPFATFDYRTLSELLASRLGEVEMAVAPFKGVEPDGTLLLGDRRVRADVVIDASGWRRVVAAGLGAPRVDRGRLSTGVETRHHHGGCVLEFWFRPPERPDGVHWAFPAGDHVREGSASYLGRAKGLREDLARFEHVDAFPPKAVHGGWFPAHLGEPTVGRAFVVGDAAGQCLPLTGEGIRPALVFGQAAGREARAVLDGTSDLDTALARYRATVERSRLGYRALERFQAWSLRPPVWVVAPLVRGCAWGPISRRLQATYWAVADPDTLEVVPGTRAVTRLPDLQCSTGPAVEERRRAIDDTEEEATGA